MLGQSEVAVDSVVSVWFTALTACGTNTANSGSDAGGNAEEEERERGENHRSLCAASVKPQNLIPLSKSDKRAYLMQFCTAFNMTCPGSSRRKRGGGEGYRKVAGSLASLAVFAIIWRKLFACKLLFVRSQGYCEKPQFAAAQLPFTLNYNSADCIPGHGPHLAPPPLLLPPLSLSLCSASKRRQLIHIATRYSHFTPRFERRESFNCFAYLCGTASHPPSPPSLLLLLLPSLLSSVLLLFCTVCDSFRFVS